MTLSPLTTFSIPLFAMWKCVLMASYTISCPITVISLSLPSAVLTVTVMHISDSVCEEQIPKFILPIHLSVTGSTVATRRLPRERLERGDRVEGGIVKTREANTGRNCKRFFRVSSGFTLFAQPRPSAEARLTCRRTPRRTPPLGSCRLRIRCPWCLCEVWGRQLVSRLPRLLFHRTAR